MEIFFEIFPLFLFFLIYKLFGLYLATGAAMAAISAQALLKFWKKREIGFPLYLNLFSILFLGTLTFVFQNEKFVKLKPTLVYWSFSFVLLVSEFFFRKNLVECFLKQKVNLPNVIFRKLNFSWAVFLFLLGGINLYIAWRCTTELWVNFKVFGMTAVMVIFFILQAFYISRFLKKVD